MSLGWPWPFFYGKVKFGNLGFLYRKNWKQWIFQKLLKPVTRKLVQTILWANEGMEGQPDLFLWQGQIW